jgi:putative ABC transport system permease protein
MPASLPRVDQIALDGAVVAFTLGVSILTGLVFGLVPALQSARPAMGEHLGGGRGTTGSTHQTRLRDLLIVSELALALMLLAGAGLMVRSLAALQSIDAGFDPHGVLSMVVSVKGSPVETLGRRAAFYAEALDRLRALPGVRAASAINHLPLHGDVWDRSFSIEGRPPVRPEERASADYRVVLPDYFKTMRLPLVRGRDFTAADDLSALRVVIVNEHFARTHWPGKDPIGRRFTLDVVGATREPTWMTIVGVVRNAVRDTWGAPPGEEMYLPYLQQRDYLGGDATRHTYLTTVVRTEGDPAALAAPARDTIASIDRAVAVADVLTMDEAVSEQLSRPRFQLTLLGLFAGVALLLAAAGIYSVMSYAIARRTQEIGLRVTLGAQGRDVVALVLGQAMSRVAIGAAFGLVGSLLLTRLMGNLLYGVRPTDPLTFGVVSLVLIGTALLASYLPARRASRIDPIVALRQE